ncbi:MAG: hypothetical protein IPQ07_35150 [Myxococcales bacterium]|nr:hypothetical protein [Myxococcales bacterium]
MRPVTTLALIATLGGACGDGIGARDAAPPPDASSGLVRVRVPLPDPDAPAAWGTYQVLFQDADGALVLSTHTDREGKANAYMAPGGYVSVVNFAGSTRNVYTWASVQPGDELWLTGRPEVVPTPDSSFVRLSLPDDPGAQQYRLLSSCGEGDVTNAAGGQSFFEFSGCAGKSDLLVMSFGETTRYLFRADVPIENNGLVSLPPPYRALDPSRLEVIGASPSTTSVFVTQHLVSEGVPLQTDLGFSWISLVGGAGAAELEMTLPADGTVFTAVDPVDGDGVGIQHVRRWGPGSSVTRFDLGASALRAYEQRPVYERTTHTLRWAEATTGVLPTAVMATWGWYHPPTENVQWRILAPRGEAPEIRLPVLPLPELRVQDGDVVNDPFELVNVTVDGGWDRLRQRLALDSFFVERPLDHAPGELVYQELRPPKF